MTSDAIFLVIGFCVLGSDNPPILPIVDQNMILKKPEIGELLGSDKRNPAGVKGLA